MAGKKEIAQIKADHAYWKKLEKVLPWHLHGFTWRGHASFFTNKHSTIELTGEQRDQILAALEQSDGR